MSKQLRKEQGFTLLEVSFSLLILISAMGVLLPLLTTVYNEKLTIREHHQALLLLNEQLLEWKYEHVLPFHRTIIEHGTEYSVTFSKDSDSKLIVCLTWLGKNKRSYEQCGFVIKEQNEASP